jgi:hypothetical protein
LPKASNYHYTETKQFPWNNNQLCMEELNTGGTLADMPHCIDELIQNNALTKTYNSMSELRDIYVNKCGDSAVLCFNPKSKNMNVTSAKYSKFGAQNPSCPPISENSPDCYVCIPISNDIACSSFPTPTTILLTDTPIPLLTITPIPSDVIVSASITPTINNCSTNPYPLPTITNCINNPIAPPTVFINTSDCIVNVDNPFTITVNGYSCVGLASVWWYGAGGPDALATVNISYPLTPTANQMFTTPYSNPTTLKRAFGSPYFTATQAVHNYSFTSTIIIPTPGVYTFKANSRDVLYPIFFQPHQASEGMGMQSVTIRVEDNSIQPYPTVYCFDNDGGLNYYQKSSRIGTGIGCSQTLEYDECQDSSFLKERYCGTPSNGLHLDGCYYALQYCQYGCVEGACATGPSPTPNLPKPDFVVEKIDILNRTGGGYDIYATVKNISNTASTETTQADAFINGIFYLSNIIYKLNPGQSWYTYVGSIGEKVCTANITVDPYNSTLEENELNNSKIESYGCPEPTMIPSLDVPSCQVGETMVTISPCQTSGPNYYGISSRNYDLISFASNTALYVKSAYFQGRAKQLWGWFNIGGNTVGCGSSYLFNGYLARPTSSDFKYINIRDQFRMYEFQNMQINNISETEFGPDDKIYVCLGN